MQFWYPTKKEIQDWLETKETEFAEKENINPRLSIEAWLDKYIFTDEHEVFFASLPSELHEWLSFAGQHTQRIKTFAMPK